jgi:FAD/FMN-containing dehydrogenase
VPENREADREIHDSGVAHDKKGVQSFWKNAQELLSTAGQAGPEDCEISILVGRDGSLHMLAEAGWELEPLRAHHGAQAAYHISRRDGAIRVEARSAGECALLEQRAPGRRAPFLLPDFPQYQTL